MASSSVQEFHTNAVACERAAHKTPWFGSGIQEGINKSRPHGRASRLNEEQTTSDSRLTRHSRQLCCQVSS